MEEEKIKKRKERFGVPTSCLSLDAEVRTFLDFGYSMWCIMLDYIIRANY